eukprot:Gb_35131 [translate_table: standard]
MEEKGSMQCRIWWPDHLSSQPPHTMLLFGWAIPGFAKSLDIVVAASLSLEEGSCPLTYAHLQGVIESIHNQMPFSLQECANLCIVGNCLHEQASNNLQHKTDQSNTISVTNNTNSEALKTNSILPTSHCRCTENLQNIRSCLEHQKSLCMNTSMGNNCHLSEQYKQLGVGTGVWIELLSNSVSLPDKKLRWIPELQQLHWEGALCIPDIHILIYELPRYGSHHFSSKSRRFLSEHLEVSSHDDISSPLRPQWVTNLEQQREPSNLDVVISAMNSAAAVQNCVQEFMKPLGIYCKRPSLISIMIYCVQNMTAASVALIATLFYIILQLISRILNKRAFLILNRILLKLFRHTWTNLHIRSCQLIYWPTILLGSGCGSHPSLAVAHSISLLKHSIWSAIAFDIFLGNVGGLILLIHCKATSHWFLHMAHDITDDILRSGCVWLMGVPAGFKLNTELAGTLGMISLNVIQVWSTLWFFIKPLFKYFIKVLAISGIFLGFTIPAALFTDVLLLATFHISILHWLVALLYSHQIQALAALLRLFRGRKHNPLRARIDSYDYSVEQHVVGSLVFTPLLLLLPTTSVFYIFFTILNTVVSVVCIGFQFLISILHAFPYAEIGMWLMWPKRFPSGIWFKTLRTSKLSECTLRYQAVGDSNQEQKVHSTNPTICASTNLRGKESAAHQSFENFSQESETAISVLGINIASLGEIICPHLSKTIKELSWSSGVSRAYKVFSGGRFPSSLDIGMPACMPWMSISIMEFWWLTYEAVLACL